MYQVIDAARYLYRPASTLPWDSEDGGYIGPTLTAEDVLLDLISDVFDVDAEGEIIERLRHSIAGRDDWTPWDGEEEGRGLQDMWQTFAHLVRYQSRFVHLPSSDRWIPSGAILGLLGYLGQYVEDSELGLVRDLASGTSIFRGRLIDNEVRPPRCAGE